MVVSIPFRLNALYGILNSNEDGLSVPVGGVRGGGRVGKPYLAAKAFNRGAT